MTHIQPTAIQTQNLTHTFKSGDIVVNNINLSIPEGSIFGFLGPNGSGKTTTLCLLSGLYKMQKGSIRVLGKELQRHRLEILQQTGTLIESPSLYGHLTATENLRVYQDIYGAPDERIVEVLQLTRLENTGRKKVKQFSLGMKQRLAIALALMPHPKLLILDEPTNGLDPSGIIELRDLLQLLNRKHGITIIISSHILSEIERICTHIGILRQGHLLFQGKLEEFKKEGGLQPVIYLETSNNAQAFEILHSFQPVFKNEGMLLTVSVSRQTGLISRILVENNIDVLCLQPVKNDLEQLFINYTNHTS